LRRTPVGFAALAVLGAGGLTLLAARGERRAAAILLGPVAAAALTCTIFFVSGEYRHAAAPSLAAGGGILVSALARRRGERTSAWIASASAALGVGALAALPRPALARAMPPDLDAGSLVRAVVADGSRDGRADEATYRRAGTLLARAPASQ